jgi:hypothetical protein
MFERCSASLSSRRIRLPLDYQSPRPGMSSRTASMIRDRGATRHRCCAVEITVPARRPLCLRGAAGNQFKTPHGGSWTVRNLHHEKLACKGTTYDRCANCPLLAHTLSKMSIYCAVKNLFELILLELTSLPTWNKGRTGPTSQGGLSERCLSGAMAQD